MYYLQILILAIVQGAAELLPVSSSAHVIVAERLMGLDPADPKMTFLLVMLHTGTMFAVLVYFWPRWRARLFPALPPDGTPAPPPSHFVLMVLLATAVTGVLGLAVYLFTKRVLHREIEELFKNLPLIAASLLAVGVFILVAGSREVRSESPVIRPVWAFLIGFVQGLCLPFRGFSRSGATISTALCCGISRALAEDFSFALAVLITPPVIVLELHRLLKAWPSDMSLTQLLLPGLVGMVFSFLAGLVALRLLSAVLELGRWKYFGVYCIVAALVVFGLAYSGVLEAPGAPPGGAGRPSALRGGLPADRRWRRAVPDAPQRAVPSGTSRPPARCDDCAP
jgi:undecaprenyl-diphosphatase